MLAQIAKKSSATLTKSFASRAFSTSQVRKNLISDLYISELKAFKPVAVSAEDTASATKAWKLPVAPKVPEVEGDITSDIAAYEAADVETEGASSEVTSEAVSDDWFVVEEVQPTHH